MGKELVKEWFSHDTGTRNDPDMIPLLQEFKAVGYGVYWSMIELLHEKGGALPLVGNTMIAIGKPIGAKPELVGKIVAKCITDYNLLIEKDGVFYSNRVLKNLEIRKKSTEQKSSAGKASATKRQQAFNDRSTDAQQNPTQKERKKESKESDQGGTYGFNSVKAPKEQEVHEAFVRMGGTQEQSKKFFDKYEATGWMMKGTPIVKWTSLIRSFLDTWAEIRKDIGDIENPGKPKMIYA